MRPSRAPDPVPRLARAPAGEVRRARAALAHPTAERAPTRRTPRAGPARRRSRTLAAAPRATPLTLARSPTTNLHAPPLVRTRATFPHSQNTNRPPRTIIDSPPSPFASALAQHPDRPLVCAPCATRTLRPRRVALASLERRHASARAALDAALDAETGGGGAAMTAARLRVAAAKTRLDASRVRAAAFARTARLEREALDAIGARLAARERGASTPPGRARPVRAPGARDGVAERIRARR